MNGVSFEGLTVAHETRTHEIKAMMARQWIPVIHPWRNTLFLAEFIALRVPSLSREEQLLRQMLIAASVYNGSSTNTELVGT